MYKVHFQYKGYNPFFERINTILAVQLPNAYVIAAISKGFNDEHLTDVYLIPLCWSSIVAHNPKINYE